MELLHFTWDEEQGRVREIDEKSSDDESDRFGIYEDSEEDTNSDSNPGSKFATIIVNLDVFIFRIGTFKQTWDGNKIIASFRGHMNDDNSIYTRNTNETTTSMTFHCRRNPACVLHTNPL